MKSVTRERPKTDRLACPWLIRNFVDKDAEFLCVPADQVLQVAEREGAHSDDAPDAEYTVTSRVGSVRCTEVLRTSKRARRRARSILVVASGASPAASGTLNGCSPKIGMSRG